MNIIHIGEIEISPTRQRQNFDLGATQELLDSLTSPAGLMHPVVLRKDGDQLILVAGERRLRAAQELGDLGIQIKHDGEYLEAFHLPYVLLTELDELSAEEAELDENTKRQDLTWQEKAAVTARLADLRKRIAARDGVIQPTIADLALEVRGSSNGTYQERTRRDLLLAKHLNDPEVAAAKSQEDAWKALKRKEETQRNRDLALTHGATFSSKLHRLYNEDSLEWMKAQPAEQFDVILTDPPYGMGADEFGDSGGMTPGSHFYKDSDETLSLVMTAAINNFYRLAKVQAHLYVFCDIDWFSTWRMAMEEAGWKCFRTPLIWYKPQGSRAPWPDKGPQRKYECILYAVKGDRPCLKLRGDVLTYDNDTNLGHPAQKPVDLFIDLLSRSVRPGDTILDPFCGTGPVFAAAQEFKCAATGVELDSAAYGLALTRIKELE